VYIHNPALVIRTGSIFKFCHLMQGTLFPGLGREHKPKETIGIEKL